MWFDFEQRKKNNDNWYFFSFVSRIQKKNSHQIA